MTFGRFPRHCGFVVASVVVTSLFGLSRLAADPVTFQCLPVADTFVRPGDNADFTYGSAGALAVAGDAAVNGFNFPNGRFETAIKFDTAAAVAAFDSAFGAGNWSLTGASLKVNEVGSPNNAIFNIGAGTCRIAWLSDDNWLEGGGNANAPFPGAGTELTWNYLQTLLTSATEETLGSLTNLAASGSRTSALSLQASFVADVVAGQTVSLHLTPETSTVGFTFNSVNNGGPNVQPVLSLTAAMNAPAGDLNCDGVRNAADAQALVLALTNPAGFAAAYPGCDMGRTDANGDLLIDGRDIAAWVHLLLP